MKGAIHIKNWHDLNQYGIEYLTGEADAYSIRLLCDLNQKGKELMETFFCVSIPENSNWNSTVNEEPAVASIMLPRGILEELAKFCLFYVGHCYAVVYHGHDIIGVNEDYYQRYQKYAEEYPNEKISFHHNPNYHPDPQASVGDRNIHQMSGRVR